MDFIIRKSIQKNGRNQREPPRHGRRHALLPQPVHPESRGRQALLRLPLERRGEGVERVVRLQVIANAIRIDRKSVV